MPDHTTSRPVDAADQERHEDQPTLDRRRIVRGTAWGIPALAVATITPAVAASVGGQSQEQGQ